MLKGQLPAPSARRSRARGRALEALQQRPELLLLGGRQRGQEVALLFVELGWLPRHPSFRGSGPAAVRALAS